MSKFGGQPRKEASGFPAVRDIIRQRKMAESQMANLTRQALARMEAITTKGVKQ